ncbi:restriction endonuclease subunit S [Sporosarcina luteola]|uniref:restriction endonuclease subunit S n=1 Tax=Sporosarcina luteola TaxID=582850 RepID=UPI00203C3C7C|nr:restriction endonuclease subunit S [Sporosarcina luteola]MCM3638232.1 restriction endonuclease subunit S [Sporosarcina luteola]
MKVKLTPYKMGDLLKVKHGFPFLGEFFSTNGKYVVLTPGNFYESGGFKRTIGKEKFYVSDFPEEYLCSEGDLIVAMTEQAEGLLGSTAIIPENNIYLHNQRIGLISWNDDIVDKQFLYYLFMTRSVRKQIRDTASGTKVKHTSPDRIYDVNVFLPDLTVQQNNAALLWMLEQKILLNNLIITELEEMTKIIYEYWFVQFDFPNVEGKPYRSSGGKMVWNERLKREIPNGWEVSPLPKHCEVIDCLHSAKPPLEFEAEQYFLLQLENLVEHGLVNLSNKYYVSKEMYELWTSRIEVNEGDLVITNAGRVGSVARIPANLKAGIGRNMTAIRPRDIPAVFLYYFMTSRDVSAQIKINADTGSFFGSLNVRGIKELCITLPSDNAQDILGEFAKLVSPYRTRIELCAEENSQLTRLRDWLLPMLMNGQITVDKDEINSH